jgi:serine/threonine protein phosphatase PrpC
MNEKSIIITEHVKQLCKGQDYTISGEINKNGIYIKYAAVFDGHGSDTVINFIRNIPKEKMDEIISTDHPVKILFDYINNYNLCRYNESSGSTICLVKIYPTLIEIINAGDSQAVVYKNNNIEFITNPHNCTNINEISRISIQKKFLEFKDTNNIKMVSNNVLYNIRSLYAVFNDNTALAVTQALGHNGKTGIKPDIYTINYNNNDTLRILVGTDGFFDMIIKETNNDNIVLEDLYEIADLPGQVILNRTINRWLQEWKVCPYLDKSIIETQTFNESECDDISIIIIDII